jgi:hypothetical protein
MSSKKHDLTFHLTPDQRATLIPHIDVDALERLLQYLAPEEHALVLWAFTRQRNQSFKMLRVSGDGEDSAMKNALLEEIWAPTWEYLGMEAIERSEQEDTGEYPLPGRTIARMRLSRET